MEADTVGTMFAVQTDRSIADLEKKAYLFLLVMQQRKGCAIDAGLALQFCHEMASRMS